ncbi:MAG: hypothetical protein WC058_15495, partial [Phycisphaeraceae bacterium]
MKAMRAKTGGFILAAIFALLTANGVRATERYVSPDGTNDVNGGYTNWEGAATTIQAAIDASSPDDVVWVTNNTVYSSGCTNYAVGSNRVAITKAITVRSLDDDFASTIIQGNWDPATTNGGTAVRCVYMAAGSTLIGFTLTNGATATGASVYDGGGIYGANTTAIVSNCLIVGNAA